ncbi:MAG: C-GCAxxG-C-C family protein [Deltaproteobacteria bacterium]|nr:C-GCAxxG-C-C family protein [Deltaproteobacteria bacterium]
MNPEVIKAMGAYGGGVARSGRVCGILTGAVGMVASIYGTGNPQEYEDPKLKPMSQSLVRRFEELTAPYGGVDCRCIVGFDLGDREKLHWFRNAPDSTRRRCESLICDMAVYLAEILERNSC